MSIVANVAVNIDIGKILRRRGLQPGGPVQQAFTQKCADLMDKYVPMQTGTLKNTRIIGDDYVKYTMPYAHYHYIGMLYLAKNGSSWAKLNERKYSSGRDMSYHGSPMRGKQWDVRMWADHKKRLTQFVARACGGRAK